MADSTGVLSDADILAGIGFAVSQNAKVINASFGGGPSNELVKRAIEQAKNTLFVIAAGNGHPFTGIGFSIDEAPVYPASYGLENILVVAATDNRDQLGRFSNFGAKGVHLAAPGVNILSSTPLRATAEMTEFNIPTEMAAIDGTSMATPFVTGAAALYWSQKPELGALAVKAHLLESVEAVASLQGKVKTGGRLNLAKLMEVK